MQVKKVDAVSFWWDELCDKMRKEGEKVGDYKVSTMGGKPAASSTTPPTSAQTARIVPKQETPGKSKAAGRGSSGKTN